MFEELLPWYERELAYLKHEAAAFAKRYPDRAGRLDLHEHDAENLDPHAERLIQSVALLAARIRRKLEDRFPELSDTLLELLFPQYLASIPSCTVVQFQVDREQGRITTRQRIDRKTELLGRPVGGVECRYRTCVDVDVWPIEIASVRLDSPAQQVPRRASAAGVASALRIGLRSSAGEPLARMGIDRLRFHLGGLTEISHGLYELLLRHAVHIELVGAAEDGREVVVALRPSALRPVGFAADEGLLEYPRNAFLGYRLLQEYFVFPEKFLFVDLGGLEAVAEIGFLDWMEIHVFFSAVPGFSFALEPANVRLNCTPAVNLFERYAEPINLDSRQGEYPVVPDARRRATTETWGVVRVEAQAVDGAKSAGIVPLFAYGHGTAVEGTHLTWAPVRSVAPDGAGEIQLSIGLPTREIREPFPEVLRVRVLCTNRDLPRELPVGGDPRGDFSLDPMPGFLKIVAVRKPTTPIRMPIGRAAHWKLIAHLALNHVSLLEDGGVALRGILELYEPTNTREARQRIASIQDVHNRRADRFLEGGVVRGSEVDVVLTGSTFAGTGHYLFSTVLDRFFAMYTAVNSFSQLNVINAENREDRIVFRPRAGMQELL